MIFVRSVMQTEYFVNVVRSVMQIEYFVNFVRSATQKISTKDTLEAGGEIFEF